MWSGGCPFPWYYQVPYNQHFLVWRHWGKAGRAPAATSLTYMGALSPKERPPRYFAQNVSGADEIGARYGLPRTLDLQRCLARRGYRGDVSVTQ
jgi:hypothetical protein